MQEKLVECQGFEALAHLLIDGTRLIARIGSDRDLLADTVVYVDFDARTKIRIGD